MESPPPPFILTVKSPKSGGPKSHFWRNLPYVQLVTPVLWPKNLGMKLLWLLTCSKTNIKFREKNWVHFSGLIIFKESTSGERSKECLDRTCVFFCLCKDETSWSKKLIILIGDCYIQRTVVQHNHNLYVRCWLGSNLSSKLAKFIHFNT
jgi:hypothetical protein